MIVFQHGRSDWVDPRYPVSGPTFNWDTIEWVVLHYTAAIDLIDGDLGEFVDDLPAYLRAIHRDYLNRQPNGYSIGYNAAVDWLGGTWELRGDTFKAAANANPSKPGDENAKTFAILMLVDGQDAATPLAAAAVRGLVAQIRSQRPKVIVLGHRDVDATQCPGLGVYAQINAGVFEPDVTPPPPDPPPVQEDEMKLYLVRSQTNPNLYVVANGIESRRLRSANIDELVADLVAPEWGVRYYDPTAVDTPEITAVKDIPLVSDDELVRLGYEIDESVPGAA